LASAHIHMAQDAAGIGEAEVGVGVADVKQGNHGRIVLEFLKKANLAAEFMILCGGENGLSQ
jgi:hypothetical protein